MTASASTSPTACRAMPKRSVGTISPTVAALAATGSSATSGTRRAPRPSCASKAAGPGKGVAGKWTDAESGEHGDLLDVIRETLGLTRFRDVADEARRFLNLPQPAPEKSISPRNAPARASSSAKRLLALCRPIDGTLAQTYLRRRGVSAFGGTDPLRFHPSCFYRADANSPIEKWPALVAAVTDLSNRITGVHRTWLDPQLGGADHGKAPIENPRRSLGDIWTHAVRFGVAQDVMAAGEGIETILSLRSVLPALPMIAALSASNLAAVVFPRHSCANSTSPWTPIPPASARRQRLPPEPSRQGSRPSFFAR